MKIRAGDSALQQYATQKFIDISQTGTHYYYVYSLQQQHSQYFTSPSGCWDTTAVTKQKSATWTSITEPTGCVWGNYITSKAY
jgi:hypothetical protein